MRITRYLLPHQAWAMEVNTFYRPVLATEQTYIVTAMDCDPFGAWQSLKVSLKGQDDGEPYQVRVYLLGSGAQLHGEIQAMSKQAQATQTTRSTFVAALEAP